MWKSMLKTNRLEIQMEALSQVVEVKLQEAGAVETPGTAIRLSHAELMQVMHTLLEINRTFRGDETYFEA
ncbi:hypothetical protein B5M42_010575 [Paenibacillus athensensis]|uniref:Uncharacterized protein n=1 Tax=Paenibacillus athensensis TaxID=1967502 RepID=A0A4Y8PSY8_9BACL|nr:hypothetical protein [Paenibacillus athensensis]MCD1259282.1 hypothetical protein [Paenibacillus athensensis]